MIYFRGCVAREKLHNVSISTQKILEHIDVPYTIIENEGCCGSFLLRTGFEDEALKVMEKTFKQIEGDKVLVSCAGCYKTFKQDYKEILGVEIDVIHSSQFFNELLDECKIELNLMNKKVTYHDPCHLGRQLKEYDASRNVISKTADLVEMKRNKENTRCCGAGAGVRLAYPEITAEIAKMRIDDAKEVEAEIIITSCPFCILNIKAACLGHQKVQDISEIILMALKEDGE